MYEYTLTNIIQKQNVDNLKHEKKSKDKKSLKFINKVFMTKHIDKKLKDKFTELLNAGRYQTMSKDIQAIEKKNDYQTVQHDLEELLKSKNISIDESIIKQTKQNVEIILSETFV
jgi:hypothetical protein